MIGTYSTTEITRATPDELLGAAGLDASIVQAIDLTILRLSKVKFDMDPLLPPSVSKLCSMVESAKKRHGRIIEAALLSALRNCSSFEAWSPGRFRVPESADSLASLLAGGTQLPDACASYTGRGRIVQIDLLCYDRSRACLRSYEIKRGHGLHDAGKVRSILRDLRCVQSLLISFGQGLGLSVEAAEARIVFWYGRCSLPKPWALTGSEADEHFGCPVSAIVEQASSYFRARLLALIEADDLPSMPQHSFCFSGATDA